MESIRRITIAIIGLAFCLGLAVMTGHAQRERDRWDRDRGSNRGWTNGLHRGWDNRGRRIGRKSGRLSWRERQRLARQRYRIYNTRNRYYRDGYLSPWERRRLRERRLRYRQNYYRQRRDW